MGYRIWAIEIFEQTQDSEVIPMSAAAPPVAISTLALPYLGYDTSTFELSSQTARGLHHYTIGNITQTLRLRVVQEKQRQELAVFYYRIQHTMAFPLPVDKRPNQMPKGIPNLAAYPWLTWLSWALEERWRLLLTAWDLLDDQAAGELLQQELAALAGWDSFVEWNGQAGLALGHIAGVLALALQHPARWQPPLLAKAKQAAHHLISQDTLPWYAERWAAAKPYGPTDIHNIPVIALVRSAQLARILEHPMTGEMDQRAAAVLQAWSQLRIAPTLLHTEGTAYDGYLMDSVTDWLHGLPERDNIQRAELLASCEPAFRSLIQHWVHSALPGRIDLSVPISDVEPEMPFWMSVLARVTSWQNDSDGRWLLQYMPPDRLPAATLTWLLTHPTLLTTAAEVPTALPKRLPNMITLRTGWASDDILVAAGASLSKMSHLHHDSGHIVIGWQNRFWVTDPGYQQYRDGDERNFSIGEEAHNGLRIGGAQQRERNAQIIDLQQHANQQLAQLDLTDCYVDLPSGARVARSLRLLTQTQQSLVTVTDEVSGLIAGTAVAIAWQLGAHLAVAFCEGWVRLSNGTQTLWMSSWQDPATQVWIDPSQLTRHTGSRGPLTLHQHYAVAQSGTVRHWLFVLEPTATWSLPTVDTARVFA